MKNKFIPLLFILSAVLSAAEIRIPRLNSEPELDGFCDDPCWEKCSWLSGFTTVGKQEEPRVKTRFKMFHNGYTLFLAVEAQEDNIGKLKKEKQVFDSVNIWMNDSIEFFLCPATNKSYFYHIIADVTGQICDSFCEDNNANGYKTETVWDGSIRVKTSVGTDCWRLEMAIPLGGMKFKPAAVWSFNLVRTRNAVTPREITSFAHNPSFQNRKPEIFQSLILEDFQPKEFNIAADCTGYTFRKQSEKKFQAEFTFHLSSTAEAMRILSQEVILLTPEGERVKQDKLRYEIYPHKPKELTVILSDVQPGHYLLDARIFGSGSLRPLLASFRNDILLEYAPLTITLLSPHYRDAIFASMKDQNIRAEIDFKDLQKNPWEITFSDADGKILSRKSGKSAQAVEPFQFDLKDKAPGKYLLKVECGGAKVTRTIQKLAPLQGEVRLSPEGVTLIDGKEFLPFGWYGNDDADGPKKHINSILDTALYPSLAALEKAFAARQAAGVKMIIYPYQEFVTTGGWKIFSRQKRKSGLTQEQRDYLIQFIPKIRNNPALLGYYLADEPENRENNPRWYREVSELLRELDPYHPCIMLNWGISGIQRFYESADILLPDCYPCYFEDGTTGKPRHCSSLWAQAATALRPSWIMPLVASWPDWNRNGVRGVPPDYDELRSQFFQALIHNVKGFNMYAYFESQRFASLMLGPDDIGKTLMILRDLLLQNTVKDGVQVQTQPKVPHFQAGLKTGKAGNILIAVNTEMKPVQATFRVNQKIRTELFVAGENRKVTLRNGSFRDSFLPGETHIYVESQSLADSVPSLAATRKAISELKASRRKPGNLIGQGEMLTSQYLDFAKGKIPPGVPKITASSDPQSFFVTAQTGSRYYLIDGLTNPKRVEYSWSPARNDKTPWIRIELPKKSVIREIRLYTPSGNLQQGTVEINGESIPFSNPERKELIVIPIPKQQTAVVRLNFQKFSLGMTDHYVKDRLLTEIEIYGVEK